jgi:hypothetical protein
MTIFPAWFLRVPLPTYWVMPCDSPCAFIRSMCSSVSTDRPSMTVAASEYPVISPKGLFIRQCLPISYVEAISFNARWKAALLGGFPQTPARLPGSDTHALPSSCMGNVNPPADLPFSVLCPGWSDRRRADDSCALAPLLTVSKKRPQSQPLRAFKKHHQLVQLLHHERQGGHSTLALMPSDSMLTGNLLAHREHRHPPPIRSPASPMTPQGKSLGTAGNRLGFCSRSRFRLAISALRFLSRRSW